MSASEVTVGPVTVSGALQISIDARDLQLTADRRRFVQMSMGTRLEQVKRQLAIDINQLVEQQVALSNPDQLTLV